MADCYLLDTDINSTANCDIVTNFKAAQEGYFIPLTHIDTITFDGTNKALVTNLTLKGTTKALRVTMKGMKPFDGTKSAGKEVAIGIVYDHETKMVIYGNTPAVAKQVKQLDNTPGIFCYKQEAYDGQDAAYVMVGVQGGLISKGGQFEQYGDKTGWEITMASEKQAQPIFFFYKTNAATTEAAIEGWLD